MTPPARGAAPEWADRAAALVRQCPLRWSVGAGRSTEEARASGWFLGAAECAAVLSENPKTQIDAARAFGGRWPRISDGETVIAPAVPVALGASAVEGVDAEYLLQDNELWREAAGAPHLLLATDEDPRLQTEPFDLLWFGPSERYLLRRGVLEIEDLFARLRTGASSGLLDRLLIRGRRLPTEMLDGLQAASETLKTEIEIERPVALLGGDRWRDPGLFLASRADVNEVRRTGSTIEIASVHGEQVLFEAEEHGAGFSLQLTRGSYPLTAISLGLSEETLVLRAAVDDRVDVFAPGMRGRLIFDLRSDLVALGSS